MVQYIFTMAHSLESHAGIFNALNFNEAEIYDYEININIFTYACSVGIFSVFYLMVDLNAYTFSWMLN